MDIEDIIYENIKNKKDRKTSRKWIRAYYTISKETGVPLKDTVNHSYCFVKSGELQRNLFGKIGVYERTEGYMRYFKFGKKSIGFDIRRDEIFWATNVIMLIEEREKLFNLF